LRRKANERGRYRAKEKKKKKKNRREKKNNKKKQKSNRQKMTQKESNRPVIMTSQLSSHGRGGAGNMADAAKSPKLHASDLETPVLKTPVVTTGRGGTGNMAKNDDPQATRLRQDVEA